MRNENRKDQIRIEELEVYAHHGVYPEENEKGQHFYVNATLYTNTRREWRMICAFPPITERSASLSRSSCNSILFN